MSAVVIYSLFAAICVAGLAWPWVGLVGFFGFVILEPNWNWRWSIPLDFPFQKYIAACVLFGFVASGLRMPNLSESAKYAIVAFAAFIGLAFLSTTQTIDHELSAFYMESLWKIVLMAILAVLLLDEPKKLWIFLIVIVLAQGYSAFQINLQYFEDGTSIYARRNWGTKGDNNIYSNLTIPLIACSGSVVVFAKKNWVRALVGVIFLLQLHQLMLLESRGAMLATAVMLVLFCYYMPKTQFAVRSVIFATVIGAALAGPPVVKEFSSVFASEEERDASAESRFALWKAGFEITADHPWLGVGPFAGQNLVPIYTGDIFEERKRKGLHNLVFEISTGTGVPATCLYFAFFYLAWRQSWKRCKFDSQLQDDEESRWLDAVSLAATVGIPGYLLGNMFSSGALGESGYALAAIGLAADSIRHGRAVPVADEMSQESCEPGVRIALIDKLRRKRLHATD